MATSVTSFCCRHARTHRPVSDQFFFFNDLLPVLLIARRVPVGMATGTAHNAGVIAKKCLAINYKPQAPQRPTSFHDQNQVLS